MKDIREIDKNFAEISFEKDQLTYYSAKCGLFEIGGFPHYEENGKEFFRFPKAELSTVRENLNHLFLCTASGMLRFMTNSEKIGIKAKLTSNNDLNFMTRLGMLGFDIYVGSEKDKIFVKNFCASYQSYDVEGIIDITPFGGKGIKEVSIYMPLYSGVEELYIGLDEGATVSLPIEQDVKDPVVFYGSSITHGGCVDRPGNTYANILGRWLDAPIYNLGLPGNALGEPEIAKVLAKIPMSAFVLDYDHNSPNPMHLANTFFPFYEIIRQHNKEIPIIMMSRPDVKSDECQIRKKIIRHAFEKARAKGDYQLYFVDGERLFDGETGLGYDDCTVDGCHPNALGAFRIAQGLYPVLCEALNIENRLF